MLHNDATYRLLQTTTNDSQMAVLCNATIQYSDRRGPLYLHKLFTSCCRRCLVSRACDWVMPALYAVLLIFSFQFSLLFPCPSAKQHSGVRGLPNRTSNVAKNLGKYLSCTERTVQERLSIYSNGKNGIQTSRHPVAIWKWISGDL